MATYVQQYKFHEDGRGDVIITLMISDSYTGLFTSIAGASAVRVFMIDDIKKDR